LEKDPGAHHKHGKDKDLEEEDDLGRKVEETQEWTDRQLETHFQK
jgi:hypothetical protein